MRDSLQGMIGLAAVASGAPIRFHYVLRAKSGQQYPGTNSRIHDELAAAWLDFGPSFR